jgi:hypothetical protein
VSLPTTCPKCQSPTRSGYGLAGGGMGEYVMCSNDDCNFFEKEMEEGVDPKTVCVVVDGKKTGEVRRTPAQDSNKEASGELFIIPDNMPRDLLAFCAERADKSIFHYHIYPDSGEHALVAFKAMKCPKCEKLTEPFDAQQAMCELCVTKALLHERVYGKDREPGRVLPPRRKLRGPEYWKGRTVVTVRAVSQPPCAETDDGDPAPDVPHGTVGIVEEVETDDPDDIRYWVRFEEPYGGVLLELEDFREQAPAP